MQNGSIKNKYYYYEFCDFNFNVVNILNLLITNYIRKIKIKKNYRILVITNSNDEFIIFTNIITKILNNLTLKNMNYISKIGKNDYKFKRKDLINLKRIKIIQMKNSDYSNYNNEFDFVILKSLTVKELKNLIINKTYHDKNENPYLLQNFIYILHYNNDFDKIYNEVFGNFSYIDKKMIAR